MSIVSEYGPVHKMTCEEFQQMVDAGVFGEDDHLELLDGAIVEMSPLSPGHAHVIRALDRYLNRIVGDDLWVNPQLPMVASRYSMPEPDGAVMRTLQSDHAHPSGADILLAVEVSLSSISFDRRKAHTYAEGGVPEYWLIDVEKRRMEIHTDPGRDGYCLIRLVDEFGEIAPGFARLLPRGRE